MVSDGRGSGSTIHPPSNHRLPGPGEDRPPVAHLHVEVVGWLRSLWRRATDEQREILIDLGELAGLGDPAEWVPGE